MIQTGGRENRDVYVYSGMHLHQQENSVMWQHPPLPHLAATN